MHYKIYTDQLTVDPVHVVGFWKVPGILERKEFDIVTAGKH